MCTWMHQECAWSPVAGAVADSAAQSADAVDAADAVVGSPQRRREEAAVAVGAAGGRSSASVAGRQRTLTAESGSTQQRYIA